MAQKIKHNNVNWVNGMAINKEHFLQMENAVYDRIRDTYGVFTNQNSYGVIPIDGNVGESVEVITKLDMDNSLSVKIINCRAVCYGGPRIEILAEHNIEEFLMDISEVLESNSSDTPKVFYILLSIDLFDRKGIGEFITDEEPPRYRHSMPVYRVQIIQSETLVRENAFPNSVLIGKLQLINDDLEQDDDYIPPCMTINSHSDLIKFVKKVAKSFSQLENFLIKIIQNIKLQDQNKNQDKNVANAVLRLAENLLAFISLQHAQLKWQIPDLPPIVLFDIMATSARVIKVQMDSNIKSVKEQMLNYFSKWFDMSPGQIENLFSNCINFEYRHYDIRGSLTQFDNYIGKISMMFNKLQALEYIGKKKEKDFFVKEEKPKPKRSFLAD